MTALLLFGLAGRALAAQTYSSGYFYYRSYDGYVSVCGYFGDETTVEIPATIAAKPVSIIESGAFDGCDTVTQILLPDTVMEVQDGAFSGAANLNSVLDYLGNEVLSVGYMPTSATEATTASETTIPETTAPAATEPVASTAATEAPTETTAAVGQYEYVEGDDEDESAKENEKNRQEIDGAMSNAEPTDATAQTGEPLTGEYSVSQETYPAEPPEIAAAEAVVQTDEADEPEEKKLSVNGIVFAVVLLAGLAALCAVLYVGQKKKE